VENCAHQGRSSYRHTSQKSQKKLILPKENTAEAALVKGIEIIPALHLLEVCAHLSGQTQIHSEFQQTEQPAPKDDLDLLMYMVNIMLKSFEIAAAGAHNLIMLGPPGTGKSMIAARLPTILPRLTEQQAQETAAIASISDQGLDVANWLKPPYRAPHHTASAAALSVAAAIPDRAKYHSPITALYFLMNCPNLTVKYWKSCANRWKLGTSPFHAPPDKLISGAISTYAAMNPCLAAI